jgi:hypothetical protein|tara:strand:- start:41 stop:958 length:918 start_codon:yes stop_codon:yes gene_type:complete
VNKMADNEIMEEIESEIRKAKGESDDFEIEIVDDPVQEAKEEAKDVAEEQGDDYGPKVQKRIQKLVTQRREAEIQAKNIQEHNAQLQKRLERLEQGSQQSAEENFNQRYAQTKQALTTAVEEGDTEAQVNFQEQMADMRAAMRIADMQKQQQQQGRQQQQQRQQQQRQQQPAQNPAPPKAMSWWQENNWFNAAGFERETAAARAIDVQLDLEGFDKNSDDYYDHLNNRLQKVFPELSSGASPSKQPRVKSRPPVAPPTGGSSSYKGNRVRMSQEQLRMARELGINDANGLKKYEAEIRRQQKEAN